MIGVRAQARALGLAFLLAASWTMLAAPLDAQTIDDGIMLPKGGLFTGSLYTHDSWDEYWEGTRKRDNGNIGTLTTRTSNWFANYGLTGRLNVVGAVPYVWTRASQGVLHGMQGVQDITLAAKYSAIDRPSSRIGALKAIGVLSAGIPLTDYTPDFQPLSIGSASTRLSVRFTVNAQSGPGWYVNGSAAHTWRGSVTLDRPYYYTDDTFFITDEVEMPRVFDYIVAGGYMRRGLMAQFSLSQQRTLGGGDIRRQDMPFVSNRMNFSKIGGLVMYPIPTLEELVFHFSYAYTVDGRNVGQSSTYTTGLLYKFRILERQTQ